MSMGSNITDNDLMVFCRWYADFHGAHGIISSVMTTCMCGYFRAHTKAANALLRRCEQLHMVVVLDGRVDIMI